MIKRNNFDIIAKFYNTQLRNAKNHYELPYIMYCNMVNDDEVIKHGEHIRIYKTGYYNKSFKFYTIELLPISLGEKIIAKKLQPYLAKIV